MKKRPKEEVGEMERLARELLDLADEPFEISAERDSAKGSRDQPMSQPKCKPSLNEQVERDLFGAARERKRSLMADLSAAASSMDTASSALLLQLSGSQVMEARKASKDKEAEPRLPAVHSSILLPPPWLIHTPPQQTIDLTKSDFSRIWAPRPSAPARDSALPQESSSRSATGHVSQSSKSKGRYFQAHSRSSRHLDAILSRLVSPKRLK